MLKPPSDNNIQSENVSVEEPESIDWVPIAIAVPYPVKQEIRDAAKRSGLKLSVWGRKVLMAALETDRRQGEADRRKAVRGIDAA